VKPVRRNLPERAFAFREAAGLGRPLLQSFPVPKLDVMERGFRPAAFQEKKPMYSGHDNLQLMSFAVNYNRAIVGGILKEVNKGRIIDFGAGDGHFAEKMSEFHLNPVCIEPEHSYLEVLREKSFECYESLDKLVEKEFDFIYSLNVLEHIQDDTTALSGLRKKLRTGGKIYILVPAWQLLYGNMDQIVGHFRRYSKKELLAKVTGAGFRVEKIDYFDSLGFFAALLYKAGKGSGKPSMRSICFYDRYIFPLSHALDFLFSSMFGKNLVIVAQAIEMKNDG
jgi:SAM-dependent methyltransferase